jgi:hypothetical protein
MIKRFSEISDRRRNQAKKYELKYILFFTVLALISNAKGYRDIHRFIVIHFKLLKKTFNLKWKKPPCNNGLISILESVNADELEECLREGAKNTKGKFMAVDGKALRGSIDNATNGRVKQLLKIFSVEDLLVVASEGIDKKTNEIPVFEKLVSELGLEGKIFTMDALHCQKKL